MKWRYDDWKSSTSTPMIIRRKFQLPESNDEPDDRRQFREKRALEDYRVERELLELRAGNLESQYQTKDTS